MISVIMVELRLKQLTLKLLKLSSYISQIYYLFKVMLDNLKFTPKLDHAPPTFFILNLYRSKNFSLSGSAPPTKINTKALYKKVLPNRLNI